MRTTTTRYPVRGLRVGVILAMMAAALAIVPSGQVAASPVPSVSLACGNATETIELGDSIPIRVTGYGNPTDQKVTFTVTMNTNMFFGPEHVESTYELPAHISVKWFAVTSTSYTTPLGTDTITVKVTSDATGSTILAECTVVLTVEPPAEMQDLIQVPVRLCAIEGSPQAKGKKPGEMVDGKTLLWALEKVNDEIWVEGAHIAFRSAPALGVPVISDPVAPDSTYGERVGDITVPGFGSGDTEVRLAAAECEKEWVKIAPGQKGIVIVNVRGYTRGGDVKGLSANPDRAFAAGQTRNNDLCVHPRNLKVSDVASLPITVKDLGSFATPLGAYSTLGHELGHALLLGHGDGLDNNSDGTLPPTAGPRRYDQYCDQGGNNSDFFPNEDASTTSYSVMDYTGDLTVTQLQKEQARAAAKLIPGAVYDKAKDPAGSLVRDITCGTPPCGIPGEIFLVRAEVGETPGLSTGFSHTVWGPLSSSVNSEYLMFADLDNTPATGCSPAAAGFPTSFVGAELVTRASVTGTGEQAQVWQCSSGSLVQVTSPSIIARAHSQTFGDTTVELFGIITVEVPNAVRGPASDSVRIEAYSRVLPAGVADRLPASGGGTITLAAPVYPDLTLTPPVVYAGDTSTAEVAAFPTNHAVDVYLGGELLATGTTDGSGEASIPITVPATSRQGLRPVVAVATGTLFNAAGIVLVESSGVNSPPVADDQTVTTPEDTPVNLQLTASDPEGKALSMRIVAGPSHGALTGVVPSPLTYRPEPDWNGTDSMIFEACDTGGLCDTATVAFVVTPVNDPPVMGDLADRTVQYSDRIVPIPVSATDIDSAALTFTATGLPAGLGLAAASCMPAGDGSACTTTIEGAVSAPAGTYWATITVVDDGGLTDTEPVTITVSAEDATVTFPEPPNENPVAVPVTTPGGDSEPFQLTVFVSETQPDMAGGTAAPGDIAFAEVSMTLLPVGPGGPVSPRGPCIKSTSGTGYGGALTVTCTFDEVTVNTYTLDVAVVGGYYTGGNEDVLVVYDPSLGFTTGGGWFSWPGSDEKTNFGYTMKYNKKGSKMQGSFLLIRHLPDGTNYRVKSNALYGLALGSVPSVPTGWASFSGKSTYLEPGWLEPIGNHEFVVYVEDHDEPGTGVDQIWLEMHDKDGNVIAVMSMDRNAVDNTQAISGGNIVVPH